MKLSIKRIFTAYAIALIAISVGAASSVFAAELTNISPNPKDMLALDGNRQIEGGVSHILKKEGVAIVTQLRVGVYSPSKTARTLKITYGIDGKKCYQDVAKNNGDILVTVGSGDAAITYTVPFRNMCSDRTNASNSKSSPNNRFFANYAIPASAFKEKKDIGLWFAPVSIRMSNGVPTGHSQGNNVNFRLEIPSNNVKIGPLATSDSTNFGLRSAYADTSRPARGVLVRLLFGAPCSAGSPARNVYLYDADVNVFGPTYLWVTKQGVGKLGQGGSEAWKNDYKLNTDSYNSRVDWVNQQDYWSSTAQEGSESTRNSYFQIKQIEGGKVYKFIIQNPVASGKVSPNANVLSIGIPYDSIYGDVQCGYTLDPDVDPPKTSSDTVPLGSNIPIRGHISPTGHDGDGHIWSLTMRVYERKPNLSGTVNSSVLPCQWRGGWKSCDPLDGKTGVTFGSNDFQTRLFNIDTGSIEGLEAGDSVCFVMSVSKPKDTLNNGRWRHSDMKCVGIRGSSTGTTVTPDTYSYFPKLTVTSNITNEGGYPKVDSYRSKDYQRNEYDWKLMEAKFSRKPSSIGTSDRGGCNTVKEVGGFLNGSCKVLDSGDNLFPKKSPASCLSTPCTKTASSKDEGPDPIGTWTCYTFSYLTNPEPLGNLMSDIDLFYDDWNDPNGDSRKPARWSDGYYRYKVHVPAERNDKGKIIKKAYWYWEYVGKPKSDAERNDAKKSFRESNPNSTTPKYKFTPYKLSSCSQSGVDPKVQIRNGDLKVAGGGIDTFVRTMEVGNAIGSYGSGGEYGVLSTGLNTGMASGSGMLRGLASGNQTDWSKLTFTNDNPSMRGFGKFDATPSDSKPAVPRGAIELGAEGVTTEDTAFNEPVPFDRGRKLVYHVKGTLRITRNLTYTNSMDRVNEIPRIVIYAENIEIAPNVKYIDPWLIADNISTCGPPRGAVWGDSAAAALGDADLHTKMCDKQLIFNGPVYANNLYLYRTGGSRVPESTLNNAWANPDRDSGIDPDDYCEDRDCGNGLNGRRYALSAPAEVFNLRPDVFLSSFSGKANGVPVATTDKITELPPRF